ncbi:DUF4376 domain-containing protein [Grimontia sp. SpTr1]|uniref:DUF4376 domain-containing protein n=1 Tax=Grimontia sp. SpTr1 TaxID=2995319 RepID=UPI00248BB495|nr:DUF4376 domain-containing protein [Grimontia sp. SpTr1]
MKYWTVDSETFEVLSAMEGDKWNKPRFAISFEPLPSKEGYAVVALEDLSDCIYVEDHRGKTAYSTLEAGIVRQVTELGPLDTEWTLDEQPTPYHEYKNGTWQPSTDRAKKAKREEINAWRFATENDVRATVIANDTVWDAGPEARMRIDSTILAGVMPPYWTDANNQDHHGMTIEELKQVKAAINLQGFVIHDKQRKMKQEVDSLESFEAVLAFNVG